MRKSDCKRTIMENQIMGRIHVGTPDAEALWLWSRSLKAESRRTMPARDLCHWAARAMDQHHANLAEYRHVMGGMK